MVMPLFTFSNETLQKWRAHLGEKKDKDNVDVAAALFAYHVVRFLERSCEEVAWEPVISNMATFHDYDLARRHWAIVLQMYWFMEKAFADPN
ncbi:hypothetical protein NUW58_g5080 [Xylaria curta]|uniref:Uncharacterized protein n=1 Tax=Xylaria curta TaxID=42375 RepID=A0ACC1P3C2_9PEZI|nr:hypothetical protein NUW58_g5080 [Xylaria curta]